MRNDRWYFRSRACGLVGSGGGIEQPHMCGGSQRLKITGNWVKFFILIRYFDKVWYIKGTAIAFYSNLPNVYFVYFVFFLVVLF